MQAKEHMHSRMSAYTMQSIQMSSDALLLHTICVLTHAFVFACVQSAKRLNRPDELLKVKTAIVIGIKELKNSHDERIASQFRHRLKICQCNFASTFCQP